MPLNQNPPVTLHLGAHRTATSSVQRLLTRKASDLAQAGLAVWTPQVTRSGLLSGVTGDPGRIDARRDVMAHRAAGRVSLLRDELAQVGHDRLLISDENMLGGLRENLLLARLYPTVSARLARLAVAIPGVDRVCLSLRSPERWWASAFAFLMTRGFAPPDGATLDAVLRSRRGWRQVVEDVAASFPQAELIVWTYEDFGHQPDAAFEMLTGHAPTAAGVPVVNAQLGVGALRARLREEGCMTEIPGVGDCYAPFTPDQRAMLRVAHTDDLAWLRDGADGMATFVTRRAADPSVRDRKGWKHGARRRSDGAMGATG